MEVEEIEAVLRSEETEAAAAERAPDGEDSSRQEEAGPPQRRTPYPRRDTGCEAHPPGTTKTSGSSSETR